MNIYNVLISLLLIVVVIMLLKTLFKDRENRLLKKQISLYEQQLKTNIENDRKIRLIKHDMKHHIREINMLASNGCADDIISYTGELSDDIKDAEKAYDTGNIYVDGILNYYNSLFLSHGIQAQISVVIPDKLEISPYDLNIMLGNLLDNAYENVIKANETEVMIDIKFDENVLYLSVANTYNSKIKKENGKIVSLKGKNHGYGLENIKRIAKKYNGDMKIEYNEKMFMVGVVLYL